MDVWESQISECLLVVVPMSDRNTIFILVVLAGLVGGIALGFFTLEEIISRYALHALLGGIFLFLLIICCHGIERPEDADTKARDDIWSE